MQIPTPNNDSPQLRRPPCVQLCSRLIVLALTAAMSLPAAYANAEADGYFTDVRKIDELDIGRWHDEFATVSADGLEIYFSSDSAVFPDPVPARGNYTEVRELFVARRPSLNAPFGERKRLSFTQPGDYQPKLTADGLTLMFSRPGTANRVWMTNRDTLTAEWSEPIPFPEVIGADEVFEVDMSVDRLRIIYRDFNERDDRDLFMASRHSTDDPFELTAHLDETSSVGRQEFSYSLPLSEKNVFFSSADLSFNFPQIRVADRETLASPFARWVNIDRFSDAANDNADRVNSLAAVFGPSISPDWPADGSKLYFSAGCCNDDWNFYEATWRQSTPTRGDFTGDTTLDIDDISLLEKAVKYQVMSGVYDLNDDGSIDIRDRQFWLKDVKRTWLGDSNLDGEFNSTDFVKVFQAGEYEDANTKNSTWATGDWNGDGEFDSGDFVAAFQEGGYEMGRRQTIVSVPESSSSWLFILLGTLLIRAFLHYDAELCEERNA